MKEKVVRNKLSNLSEFKALVSEETHYVQIPRNKFNENFEKIKIILLDLGFNGKYVDLAYATGKGVRKPESHDDKAEVYFMLTDSIIFLNNKEYQVNAGDVVIIPKNVVHQPQSPDARYLMANIRDEKPKDVWFVKL